MKSLIAMTVLSLMINITSHAQLQVGEQQNKPTLVGRIKVIMARPLAELEVNKDSVYTLTFRDIRYTQISSYKTIAFEIESLDQLYNVLYKAIQADDQTTQSIKLSNNNITLVSKKILGRKHVAFIVDDAYFYMSEKQLKELFNK